MTEEKLGKFTDRLMEKTAAIKELEIKSTQVSVFFPPDIMKKGLGSEIIIKAEIFIKPERTEEVRNRLAIELVKITREFFLESSLVECFIKPINLKNGFYTSDRYFERISVR